MATRQGLTVRIHIEGARAALNAFRHMPKEANDDLRRRTLELSETLARRLADAARDDSPQSALIAPTVKANKDRVPNVSAGGTRRVGRHRMPASKIVYATEFGMNKRSGWYAHPRYAESDGRQYRPHLGRGSYWFFRTVENEQATIANAWRKVADDVVHGWVTGRY